MKRLIVVLLAVLVLFSSCSFLPSSLDGQILEAPIMNQVQKEIYDELSKVIPNFDSILFQYPSYQGQRSPFVFHDLDSDGVEETVIVFYSFKNTPEELFAKVMRLDEDKHWKPFYDIPCYSNDIIYINFAPLIDKKQSSLMIGWRKENMDYLGIYSITQTKVITEFFNSYNNVLAQDIDGDDLSEMLLVQNGDGKFAISLYKNSGSEFKISSTLELHNETVKVHQLMVGNVNSSRKAVYIDEEIGGISTSYATEIVEIKDNKLELVVGGNSKDKTKEIQWERFTKTFRTGEMVLSTDLWEDGTIEVPDVSEYNTYGQSYSDGSKEPRLVYYMQLENDELVVKYHSLYNTDFEYFIHLPEKWMGEVIVVEQPQRKEWRFYKINKITSMPTTELLRIRVFFSNENKDEIANEDFLLATKDLFNYYGYIPATGTETLAVTEDEVQKTMFDLT